MVEKENTLCNGQPPFNVSLKREFVEANQTDLYEIINKNQPRDIHYQIRELCEFQHWLGSNYDNLPTDSVEMTERAIKFMSYIKDKEMKL